MASKEDAKQTIVSIAKEYGFIDDDVMNRIEIWDPSVRQTIEESMLAKDMLAAHSIKTLAKNIYGSDARFVFELLQNADDNRFTRASDIGVLPFILFKVHPDRIVIDCNEDGFTEADLRAICAIGQSSKSASYGYIGAKGIGFKSVFIAAWKVYIQSGHFSFYFKHEKGDPGLGMVQPVWEDADENLPGPLTRMTLHLHEKGDSSELEHLRQTIRKQLSDLQQTCLLFLQKLKKIRVEFYTRDGALESCKSFHVDGINNHNVSLRTTVRDAQREVATHISHYHVVKHVATELPRSDSRDVPDTEEARSASSIAEVVLAFPLTIDSNPLIGKQEIFAFLPVRESEFNFVIQSDFDTGASRQDIVTTSRRNLGLLDFIAAAFITAVLRFCEHPTLCYTWPAFLPLPESRSNTFWTNLKSKIMHLVSTTPLLKSRNGEGFRKIEDVVILPFDFQDRLGNPLLDDSALDPFLSKAYPSSSSKALEKYGLKAMGYMLLLDMVSDDLRSPSSRMKSKSVSNDWHSAVALLLMKLVRRPTAFRRLERLPLFPLRNGEWVSIHNGLVYLPTTMGILIPPGVDHRVLDSEAVANADRKSLFVELGAEEQSVAIVRASILRAYSSGFRFIDIGESKAHLHYLYLTHTSDTAQKDFKYILVYSEDCGIESPHKEDFYFTSDHPYGPEALLRPHDGAPGHPVTFIHPTYLQDVPTRTDSVQLSWKTWLHQFISIRERLRLVSRTGNSLSDVWTYVAEYRPKKLLGMLEYLWKYERERIEKSESLKKMIRRTEANKLCINDLSRQCDLGRTFLPLPQLQQQCLRFMETGDHFPFLELETVTSSDKLRKKWSFLHDIFSVGMHDDISFFLSILSWIRSANSSASRIPRVRPLLDLYIAIDEKSVGFFTPIAVRMQAKEFFTASDCIFVPAEGGHDKRWVSPKACLWDAPPNMLSKHSLKHLYAPLLTDNELKPLAHLFSETLSMPGASWGELTVELQHLRDNKCDNFDRILSLYEYCTKPNILAFSDELREEFATKSLIFVVTKSQPGWYKSSDCLWSLTTEIRGKVTLNDHYESLKDFFVETLGVKTLTLRMVYDELLHTGPQMSVKELKSMIWSFNALLQADPVSVDPKALLKTPIFPVKYPDGTKALRSIDTEFAIADREYLASQFKGRIKLLDYTLAEVWHLKPFFEWANLTDLYLSTSVKEISSVTNDTTRPISMPNRDLKRKAHALLRIAATFKSPRYDVDAVGLYRLLQNARVEETNGISSVLRIVQDGRVAEVRRTIGDMHISEILSGLTIYVPMDKEKQEYCFAAPLPDNLGDWLMRDPITQIPDTLDNALVAVLSPVLTCDVSVVSRVLERKGIIQVPIPEDGGESVEDHTEVDIYVPDDDDDDDDDDAATISQQPSSWTSERFAGAVLTPRTPSNETYHGSASIVPEPLIARRSRFAHGAFGPAPTFSTPLGLSTEDVDYRALLIKVVQAARRAIFPTVGVFDMTDLHNVLPGEDNPLAFNRVDGLHAENRFRSSSQLERDKKIGAAGELYVFELLSRLTPALSGWGRGNWQSTIRRYVTVHPDYADMGNWLGRETSDLVYEDTEGNLTHQLVDSGYLDDDEWNDARPRYYIEVKTTTGPCRTPFYMSKYQYQRMRDVHYSDDYSEVYLILRVFELETEQIGMCVYVDPEQLKLEGRLEFTGETWSVVPN